MGIFDEPRLLSITTPPKNINRWLSAATRKSYAAASLLSQLHQRTLTKLTGCKFAVVDFVVTVNYRAAPTWIVIC
jgi:hypothetical protein